MSFFHLAGLPFWSVRRENGIDPIRPAAIRRGERERPRARLGRLRFVVTELLEHVIPDGPAELALERDDRVLGAIVQSDEHGAQREEIPRVRRSVSLEGARLEARLAARDRAEA